MTALDERSRYLRGLIIDALEGGGRGHVGSALSLVEIVRILYDEVLRVRPDEPQWPDRDRFILSKGHGCLGLYVMLADKGFFPREELLRQCKAGALLGGHPETHIPGVEASTGALGHGLNIGIGMALAARMQKRPSRVFVVLGDGELNEGSVWEGLMCAAKHKLSNLVVMVDSNKMQSYGRVEEVMDLGPLPVKFAAFGCAVREVDGHDVQALRDVFAGLPVDGEKPTAIICHTVKGKGISFCENDATWHHKASFKAELAAKMRAALETI
ncbi:transketolase [Azospirillum sp. B4]|uniref:transketolase n=1 Tax=Azospirillum sp. B4 TaxID=95605 RepID=UPI00034CD989|nr:transketolase [Azospirillum sp. B4]